MITIYHHPLSTFCRRLKLYEIEKGIEFNWQKVALEKRENDSPDYRRLNPLGQVPTLKEDSFVLYESAEILRYLEERYTEKPLLSEQLEERAQTMMHIKLCDDQFAKPIGEGLYARRFLPEKHWDTAAIQQLSEDVDKHFKMLGTMLTNHVYLVGNQFSLADLAYIPFLDLLKYLTLELPPNVQQWHDRLMSRHSATSTQLTA